MRGRATVEAWPSRRRSSCRAAAHRRPAADRGARAAPRRTRGASGSPRLRSRPTRCSAPPSRCGASTGPGGCAARTSRAPGARSAAGRSSSGTTVVVGHELLAGATPDEIALLVDGLAGTEVHVVVLAGVPDGRVGLFPDELDLGSVLDRWAAAISSPDRLHVVVTDPADATVAWRALGSLVGFDADRLALPDPAGLVVAGGRGLAAADRRVRRRPRRPRRARRARRGLGQGGRGPRLRRGRRPARPRAAAGRPLDRPGARGVRPARGRAHRRRWRRPSPRSGGCASSSVSLERADRKGRSVRLPGVLVRGP